MEFGREVVDEPQMLQVVQPQAVNEGYNMVAPSTQNTQVGHTRGLAAEQFVVAADKDRMVVAYDTEFGAKGTRDEPEVGQVTTYNQQLIDHLIGSKVAEDMKDVVRFVDQVVEHLSGWAVQLMGTHNQFSRL